MAIMLPGDAHAAVHVRVRRRDRSDRAATSTTSCRASSCCAPGFGAASTAVYVAGDMKAGIIDRFRTMPLRSERGAHRARRREPAAQPARDRRRDRGRAAGRLPSDRGLRGAGSAAIGVIALYILTITYLFAAIGLAAGSPEAASGYGFIILFLPYLSSAFVPVDTMPAVAAVDRREPAGHADHRDDPRPAVRAAARNAAVVGDRLVPRHPAGRRRLGRVAVPPQGRAALSDRRVSGRAASSARSRRVLGGCRGAADDVGRVRRRVGERRDAGQFAVGIHPLVEERDQPVVDFVQRARTTGCSSGAGPLRAPRRGAPRAAP